MSDEQQVIPVVSADAQERKHQRQIAGRANEEQFRQRVSLVIQALSNGRRPSEIKRFFSEQWNVRPRTLEGYLCRAREELLREVNTTKPEMRSRALAWYQAQIANNRKITEVIEYTLKNGTKVRKTREAPEVSLAIKVAAQEAIRKMLGLDAPTKIDANVSADMLIVHSPVDPQQVTGPPPEKVHGRS